MKHILKLLFLTVFAASAFAQFPVPGMPDRTFGRRGILTEIPPTGTTYNVLTTLTQPDGKIVAVVGENIGGGMPTPGRRFALIRYNRNGTRDGSFGNEGISDPPFGSAAYPNAAALQPDGKILVVGRIPAAVYSGDSIVARYMPDGRLDTSFGNGGLVITDTSTPDARADENMHNVFVQSDGKIILVGFRSRLNRSPAQWLAGSFLAFRYMPDGSLDSSFGNGGISAIPMQYEDEAVFSAMNAADGRIVISGREVSTYTLDRAQWIVTLNADGSVRNQFPQTQFSQYQILEISDYDGELLFSDAPHNLPKLFTLKSDGQLAGIFYSGTPLTINGYDFWPGTLMVLPNDRQFISFGTASSPAGYQRALVRFDLSGFVDRSYGVNGIGYGPYLSGGPVLQPDGGVLETAGFEGGFRIAKYCGDPQIGLLDQTSRLSR